MFARIPLARRLRHGALLVGCCLPLACGGSDDPPAAQREPRATAAVAIPADAPLVVFLGDSISAGLHLSKDEAFPALLQARLAEDGLPFRLVNAGVSGDTTAGGLRRLEWLLSQEPELVVVELGGNDGLRGIPLEEIESNLDAILRRLRERGLAVLVLGMRIPTNYGVDYEQGFAALFRRAADQHGARFVPYFMQGVGGVPELNLPDGLHPTAEGHERLADTVEPHLRALLETLL